MTSMKSALLFLFAASYAALLASPLPVWLTASAVFLTGFALVFTVDYGRRLPPLSVPTPTPAPRIERLPYAG